jgi:hypothetical protein
MSLRLTANSDETDLAKLLAGEVFFVIPYFQRPYRWTSKRVDQLHEDVIRIDEEDDSHFLGAIIVHGRQTMPSDPGMYDVIDGQQRVTTAFLYVAAVIKNMCRLKEFDAAKSLFLRYLVIGRSIDGSPNIKLQPCKEDRAQMNGVFLDLYKSHKFVDELGGSDQYRLLTAAGPETGKISTNYKKMCSLIKKKTEGEDAVNRLHSILAALLQRMTVVQIDVSDPTNGPKIFDSLNSRQEPMTIGDLVRNEVFSRAYIDHQANGEEVDAIFNLDWVPFYEGFQVSDGSLFDAFFFPFGLIQDENAKKSDVFDTLRKKWGAMEGPRDIIQSLRAYQPAFLDCVNGGNESRNDERVSKLIGNLVKMNRPASIYPFLMRLVKASSTGAIEVAAAVEVLEVLESFLVRRAVCGIEPTGLHAVFKKLWSECDGHPTGRGVSDVIRNRSTVPWPADDEVRKAVRERPLYKAAVTRYVIGEYDRAAGGDNPEGEFWIEHVLPQNPASEWFEEGWNQEQHSSMKNLIANLVPLTEEMNQTLSNGAYSGKKDVIVNDSMYKSAREFAANYGEWTAETLLARSEVLAKWVVERWSH